jgi:hypothetical protein
MASISAENRKIVREINQSMSIAWHIAAFGRMKKMPKLSNLLMRTPSRNRQTWQEQLAVMDAWMNAKQPDKVN